MLAAIAAGTPDVDSVCEITGLNAGFVTATMTHLQLTGIVRRLAGYRFEPRSSET